MDIRALQRVQRYGTLVRTGDRAERKLFLRAVQDISASFSVRFNAAFGLLHIDQGKIKIALSQTGGDILLYAKAFLAKEAEKIDEAVNLLKASSVIIYYDSENIVLKELANLMIEKTCPDFKSLFDLFWKSNFSESFRRVQFSRLEPFKSDTQALDLIIKVTNFDGNSEMVEAWDTYDGISTTKTVRVDHPKIPLRDKWQAVLELQKMGYVQEAKTISQVFARINTLNYPFADGNEYDAIGAVSAMARAHP